MLKKSVTRLSTISQLSAGSNSSANHNNNNNNNNHNNSNHSNMNHSTNSIGNEGTTTHHSSPSTNNLTPSSSTNNANTSHWVDQATDDKSPMKIVKLNSHSNEKLLIDKHSPHSNDNELTPESTKMMMNSSENSILPMSSTHAMTTIPSKSLQRLFDNVEEDEEDDKKPEKLQDAIVVQSKGNSNGNVDMDDDEEEDEDEDDDGYSLPQYDDLDTLLNHFPLLTLGPAARDVLSRQQLNIIRNMWLQLRNGVDIIKHGRHGKPKEKVLYCDAPMTKLFWKNPGSTPVDDDDNANDDETTDMKSKDTRRRSSIFGVAQASLSSTFRRTSDQNRVMLFREITQVTKEFTSEVMQRSINKEYYFMDGNLLITIGDAHRTLDFEIDSNLWPGIYHALQVLMFYYQGQLTSSIQSQHDSQQSSTGGGGGGGGGTETNTATGNNNNNNKMHFFPNVFR